MSNKAFYPVIDTDPHASRVMSYMRPSDYAIWAGATAVMPALLYAWERIDTTKASRAALRSGLKLNAVLGFTGGFLLAYQTSSQRFWGDRENARERERDYDELSARARAGLPIYGESVVEPHIQAVAARNSTNSQAFFMTIPWFNLVNHPHHGVDTSKYLKPKAEALA